MLIKNMLSEKLSEIENEDKEILRELDENIKALEPVKKFLEEMEYYLLTNQISYIKI